MKTKLQVVTSIEIELGTTPLSEVLARLGAFAASAEFLSSFAPALEGVIPISYESSAADIPCLIDEPLTEGLLATVLDENGWLDVTIKVSIEDFTEAGDIEGLNDLAESRIVADRGFLSDISYTIRGVDKVSYGTTVEGYILVGVKAQIAGLN